MKTLLLLAALSTTAFAETPLEALMRSPEVALQLEALPQPMEMPTQTEMRAVVIRWKLAEMKAGKWTTAKEQEYQRRLSRAADEIAMDKARRMEKAREDNNQRRAESQGAYEIEQLRRAVENNTAAIEQQRRMEKMRQPR